MLSIRSIVGIFSVFICTSCTTVSLVDAPYATHIPKEVRRGDVLKIVLVDGTRIGFSEVREVWPDSLRLAGEKAAIPYRKIVLAERREVDAANTTGMVVLVIAMVGVLALLAFSLQF
jgi:hypothetical protein